MKTKFVMPWNLKIGQKLITRDGFFDQNLKSSTKIVSIKKERGYFTGANMWRVEIERDFLNHFIFHGKTRNLPPQKVEIEIE